MENWHDIIITAGTMHQCHCHSQHLGIIAGLSGKKRACQWITIHLIFMCDLYT